jgi:hydrogenase nickel incorporation protein HypA/HybF
MHEMSIALELLEQVLAIAKKNSLNNVSEIEIEAGMLRLIEPEAMRLAWESACEGTAAAGSALILKEIPPSANCRNCKYDFLPSIVDFRCPKCNKADIEIINGNEIILKSVSGDKME